MDQTNNIPVHELSSDYKINIEAISHINPYDFKTFHRHSYYEILVFEKGGGYQQIDFKTVLIKDNSCYLVRPRQIHLVKRATPADGLLIQFSETMILPDVFLNALSFLNPTLGSEILFEQNETATKELLSFIRSIKYVQDKKSYFFKEKTVHLLSNLLYSLEEFSPNFDASKQSEMSLIASKFVELVQLNLNSISINEYSKKLNISNKKLARLVKQQFNTTPLKYVHMMLLIAIKRDLVFKKQNYKEIAFNYHFDSASNFSIFIKKHTGKTPSQLQESLRQL